MEGLEVKSNPITPETLTALPEKKRRRKSTTRGLDITVIEKIIQYSIEGKKASEVAKELGLNYIRLLKYKKRYEDRITAGKKRLESDSRKVAETQLIGKYERIANKCTDLVQTQIDTMIKTKEELKPKDIAYIQNIGASAVDKIKMLSSDPSSKAPQHITFNFTLKQDKIKPAQAIEAAIKEQNEPETIEPIKNIELPETNDLSNTNIDNLNESIAVNS